MTEEQRQRLEAMETLFDYAIATSGKENTSVDIAYISVLSEVGKLLHRDGTVKEEEIKEAYNLFRDAANHSSWEKKHIYFLAMAMFGEIFPRVK